MKIIKILLLIISIGLLSESCKKDECPEGFLGANCETFDSSKVQVLLDSENYTPLFLFNKGVPLDSLYGKFYQDGVIFYIDVNDEHIEIEGLVAAYKNQGDGAEWGCWGIDIDNLNNVSMLSSGLLRGAAIGDGQANTTAILKGCSTNGIAAMLCRDLGERWFLPSIGELQLMESNLHLKDLGDFSSDAYWSSTEDTSHRAWNFFFTFSTNRDGKISRNKVRAAKSF